MAQTVLTFVAEVQPRSVDVLGRLIQDFLEDEERPPSGYTEKYDRLKEAVPSLHFMSVTIFEDAHYDPIFVLEANFDGPAGPFWAQLEAAIGERLRDMLRCCEAPRTASGAMFDAIVRPDSRMPVAPFLDAQTVRPMVFHQGNRGLDRGRILREGELFLAARAELAAAEARRPNPYRPADGPTIHRRLRDALRPRFPWLDEAAPERIPRGERAADVMRLVVFAFVVLFCLSIPGTVLALAAPGWAVVLVSVLAAAAVASRVDGLRDLTGKFRRPAPVPPPSPSPAAPQATSVGFAPVRLLKGLAVLALALAAYVAALAGLCGLVLAALTPLEFSEAFGRCARVLALGLTSVPFTAVTALLWLRWLERRDPSQDAPPLDDERLREIMRREDRIVQNHMGSMVLVKPGVLRAVLIRAGLLGLGLLLRVTATSGYLASMRTIHFAHWALVSNGSRLMFFSNFDGSWESYLDDFIEKAHNGLTLAWANGVGFPPARFIFLEGATHGRKFKAWARHSQTLSRFWFSAYRDYTVDQIERHARVAAGLRRTTLSAAEAAAWARDL